MNQTWLDQWINGDTPFHISGPHPALVKYWPALNLPHSSRILVPLCGKSPDLMWLATLGHDVVGVELSEIACRAFFEENDLSYQTTNIKNFVCYQHEHIRILCGDFFELTPDHISTLAGVYDRASLIALPSNVRQQYAHKIKTLMPRNSPMLVIVIESDEQGQGPPFTVSLDELNSLYPTPAFNIHICARVAIKEISPHLQLKGYKSLKETTYQIRYVE